MPNVGFRHSIESRQKMSAVKLSNNPLDKRFWSKVNKNGPLHPICGRCWVWTGCTFVNGLGYGQISASGYPTPAHRVSWTLHNGTIPEGMLVLHRCDNPLCVNPSHLFLGTHLDNNLDMHRKGRAVIPQGEDRAQSKLTELEVRQIRDMYATGRGGYKKLARLFKVAPMTIARIVRHEAWRHV